MGLWVQKFGGTSVATPERIRSVAKRIAHTHSQGHKLVVVVSAMGHTTDELVSLAEQVSHSPPTRELDMLLTTGERISMSLLSMALSDLGVQARSFTGSQTGIITDDSHSRARIRRILGDRVREALAHNEVAIVAGFQGMSEAKEITTLGRGGSDTTAVALAAALNADQCEIYTDVDGVYSADPRLVPDARFREEISFELMAELAARGAGVLHPRSVELGRKFGIPIRVVNSLKPEGSVSSTRVIKRENFMKNNLEAVEVVGVTADKGKQLLRVHFSRATVLGSLWSQVQATGLTAVSPQFDQGNLWVWVDRNAEKEWKKILDQLIQNEFVKNYEWDSALAPVSVVGECFSQNGGALTRVLEVLEEAHIPARVASASSLALTVGVPCASIEEAVKTIHSQLVRS